jgi:hypothetical protein
MKYLKRIIFYPYFVIVNNAELFLMVVFDVRITTTSDSFIKWYRKFGEYK